MTMFLKPVTEESTAANALLDLFGQASGLHCNLTNVLLFQLLVG
jgi:hypothetical protein